MALPRSRPRSARLERIIDTIYTGGFDGAVAVEHEDPVWGGTHTKIKQGLEIAAQAR